MTKIQNSERRMFARMTKTEKFERTAHLEWAVRSGEGARYLDPRGHNAIGLAADWERMDVALADLHAHGLWQEYRDWRYREVS